MKLTIANALNAIINEINLPKYTLKKLAKEIFNDCSSLEVQHFDERGFSGSIQFSAQGTKKTGSKTITCIMKISQKGDIEREFGNYKEFVKDCLDHP